MEPKRIVIRFFQLLMLGASLIVVSTTAIADLRVLFRFDESGHHVHSVTEAPVYQSLRKSEPEDATISPDSGLLPESLSAAERVAVAVTQLRATTATLLWFDASGVWLSNSEVPDPRVAHAPAHIDGVNESQVGFSSGAWLATGPDDATEVTILFPAHAALALGFEEWHATLSKK